MQDQKNLIFVCYCFSLIISLHLQQAPILAEVRSISGFANSPQFRSFNDILVDGWILKGLREF
jgi:hypothetical protein